MKTVTTLAEAMAIPSLLRQLQANGTWKVYELGDTLPPNPPAPEPTCPSEVTARQLRLALNQLGMRAAVEAYVAAGSQDLRDWWEYEVSLQRRHPLMLQAQADLGLTDAQGDAIFALAGTL